MTSKYYCLTKEQLVELNSGKVVSFMDNEGNHVFLNAEKAEDKISECKNCGEEYPEDELIDEFCLTCFESQGAGDEE